MIRAVEQSRHPDRVILWIAGITAAFGVLMVYDASAVSAALRQRFQSPVYFFERQFCWFLVGLAAMIMVSRIPLSKVQRSILPLTLLVLVLMILVLIPGIGYASGGAHRWIRVSSFSVQPGEFMRIVLVLYLAHLFSIKADRISKCSQVFLPAVTVTGAAVVLLVAQPKFGSAMILVIMAGIMFVVAGIPIIQLLAALISSLPVIVYATFHVDYVTHRIQAWLYPAEFVRGVGFQTMQSLIAIGSGNLTGVGLGQGHQKMFYLPEAHTDMIFPVIAEELGLVGSIIVLGAFTCIFIRGFRIAKHATNSFARLMAVGLTASVLLPFILNLFVATRLFPVTGIPLPLISYGGTALVTDMIALGLLAGAWTSVEKIGVSRAIG
ncbi:putative lipid II flippase FtsW [bacterium]|nr:putative lipid II flippase FtsW [candidate division CSSED10-310 bacterium]